jgi:hypothetical protein
MCQGHRSHYVRDGSFAEDASRIRCNPGIFARLRSFAANIFASRAFAMSQMDATHRLRRHQCDPRHARHVLSVEQPWGLRQASSRSFANPVWCAAAPTGGPKIFRK